MFPRLAKKGDDKHAPDNDNEPNNSEDNDNDYNDETNPLAYAKAIELSVKEGTVHDSHRHHNGLVESQEFHPPAPK